MSAIWGIIAKNDSNLDLLAKTMTDAMSIYDLDRTDTILQRNVFFACGHQYITPESIYDVSPFYDSDNGIYFCADCFIYNRTHVINSILAHPEFKSLTDANNLAQCGDSQLAYFAYKLMGNNFVSILRGSFSFAIYCEAQKELHLFSDHLFKRYLAYSVTNDFICFATTYKPIKACLRSQLKINRSFIANAYKNMSPMMFDESEETIYSNVYHLTNASHVTIDFTHQIKRTKYWNPLLSVKKLKYDNETDFKNLFLSKYTEITQSLLRARKETGIMLSGGLDSASVAALAAPYLEKHGKKLYSYTSIPLPEYNSTIGTQIIEDESYLIEEQRKKYSNLIPRYVSGAPDNCMTHIDSEQKLYDSPIKPVINNLYITKCSQRIQEDNCSIVLTGSNGNATVSYGYITQCLSLAFTKGHFAKAYREMFAYCKKNKISRKRYFTIWTLTILKDILRIPSNHFYYLQKDDITKYNLKHDAWNNKRKFGTNILTSERQKKNFMYMPSLYTQKSFFYTSQGLLYGYLEVDPTLTVEMIELCLSLPDECFGKDGTERRLIKEYMKDLLPAAIIADNKGVGIQSADSTYRINKDWDMLKNSVYDVLSDPILANYLDSTAINELIDKMHSTEYNFDKPTACHVAILTSLAYFLRDAK